MGGDQSLRGSSLGYTRHCSYVGSSRFVSSGSSRESCFTYGLSNHIYREFPSLWVMVALAKGATSIKEVPASGRGSSRGRRDGYQGARGGTHVGRT